MFGLINIIILIYTYIFNFNNIIIILIYNINLFTRELRETCVNGQEPWKFNSVNYKAVYYRKMS